MATLGQKLRELRHLNEYKLNDVAEGADLSISFISLIERDKASISVDNLQKLANFYNIRLFEIFQDIEEEDAFIVRQEQLEERRDSLSTDQPFLFMLSPEDNLSFKTTLAHIPASLNTEALHIPKGEIFIFVMDGKIEISTPNKKSIILKEGDSAHLTSFKGIYLRKTDARKQAKLLIVASATTQYLDFDGNVLRYHVFTA